MEASKLILLICIIVLCIYMPISVDAQASWAANAASKMVAALIKKGGQQEAGQIAKMGGNAFAEEVLEKATQEGGENLGQRLVAITLENGINILKVAQQSPSKFISAFDELTLAMQKAAAQAINREPELMTALFSNIGKDALRAAAQNPGVGTKVMEELGKEGAETLGKITTDQSIQLCRLAPQIAKVAEPQRQTLIEMIGKAPGRVLDLLESHPKVLTVAGVASLIAGEEIISRGAKPYIDKNGLCHFGFINSLCAMIMDSFKSPLSALIWIAGIIFLAWGCIKLWAVFRIEKTRVHIKESKLTQKGGR